MNQILMSNSELIAKINKETLEMAEKLEKAIEETKKKVSEMANKK